MDEEIKKIMAENLELTRETHLLVKKIHRHMVWQRVVSLIYLFLIIGPIILAFIYLPPIIGPVLRQYQELLGGVSRQQQGLGGGGQELNLQNWQSILDSLQKSDLR